MPKLQWNASQITTAKTPTVDAKRTIYTFEGVRNLQLESFADGRRVWRARYRVYTAGKRVDRAVTLGELKHVPPGRARTMLTDIEQKVNAGDDPWGEDRAARQAVAVEDTFNSLVLDWIHKHSKVHKRSWALDEYLHQHHIATRPLGGKTVVEIERRDIIEALDDIASQSGGAQANRVQGLISAVFSWAVDEGKLESSPAFRIRKRAKEQPRSPTITDNVIQRLWLAWGNVPDDIGDVMRLLLLTGQRCSEVCGMRVDEIQLNERLWVLPSGRNRTKNDQAHSVPLVDDAWQIVDRARKQARNGFLFPGRGAEGPMSRHTPSHRFFDVAKELEIENFRLHDLRHAVKTYMRGLGVPADISDRVQGQISGLRRGVGWRYDHHDYLEEKRKALSLWECRLREIIALAPSSGRRW
jgi:integrase